MGKPQKNYYVERQAVKVIIIAYQDEIIRINENPKHFMLLDNQRKKPGEHVTEAPKTHRLADSRDPASLINFPSAFKSLTGILAPAFLFRMVSWLVSFSLQRIQAFTLPHTPTLGPVARSNENPVVINGLTCIQHHCSLFPSLPPVNLRGGGSGGRGARAPLRPGLESATLSRLGLSLPK
jgi:hypothetical protein